MARKADRRAGARPRTWTAIKTGARTGLRTGIVSGLRSGVRSAVKTATAQPPLDRVASLLDPARTNGYRDQSRGYLDLIGGPGPETRGLGQASMRNPVVSRIYERYWRQFFRFAMGSSAPSITREKEQAREALSLRPGGTVLDVGCGPGLFTSSFAKAVAPDGLAVGLDASPSMLTEAVRTNNHGPIAFVRGDAAHLPFADHSFDAVACFFALYFFPEPFLSLAEMVRVMAPGGRVSIATTARHRSVLARPVEFLNDRSGGGRVFGRDEVTEALAAEGCVDIQQRIVGAIQFVTARKPA